MNLRGAERTQGHFALAASPQACEGAGCRLVEDFVFGAWASRVDEQTAFAAKPVKRSPHIKRVSLTLHGSLGSCTVSDGPRTAAPRPEVLRALIDELETAHAAATPVSAAP